jgi:predicted GNAT superfamily acetyltransferase
VTATLAASAAPAAAQADRALAGARVTVRQLDTLEKVKQGETVLGAVWRSPRKPPIAAELLRAIEHAGGYVFGAYEGDTMIAVSAGFLGVGDDGAFRLHSHISGVLPTAQGRQVGWAMKLHQRAWSLERGVDTVTWTFDPLIRRNAWFNLSKLGATGVEYLADFYGQMHDGINAGDRTDRLFVRWDLLSAAAAEAVEGRAVKPLTDGATLVLDELDGLPKPTGEAGPETVLVRLPADAETMRREQPEAALAWRLAVRNALSPLLDGGRRVTAVTHDGCLVIDPAVEGAR